MKKILNYLANKSILFSSFNLLNNRDFNIRKKMKIYDGVGLNSNLILVVHIEQKSRFLQKNADILEEIVIKIVDKLDHNYKNKILFLSAPLCSKAKIKLKDEYNWKVINDTL